VRIGESARKRGIADEDIWHAVRNPVRAFERGEVTMVIGAARDGSLLEVGILGAQSDDPLVIHAMKMRQRFRKYL
jgi:hypothetical protein